VPSPAKYGALVEQYKAGKIFFFFMHIEKKVDKRGKCRVQEKHYARHVD
jgi:hypothetical protein